MGGFLHAILHNDFVRQPKSECTVFRIEINPKVIISHLNDRNLDVAEMPHFSRVV